MTPEYILALIWFLIQSVTAVTPQPETLVTNSTLPVMVDANSSLLTNISSLSLNSTIVNLNDTATVTPRAFPVTLAPPVSLAPAEPVTLAPFLSNTTAVTLAPLASNATAATPAPLLSNATEMSHAPPSASNLTATVTVVPPLSNATVTVTLAPNLTTTTTTPATVTIPIIDTMNVTLDLSQSTDIDSTTEVTTTEVPPPATTEEEISEAEARSDEESRSSQTIEAVLFDDESTVLKIFIKEKTIEFKIKLNLTNSTLERRNDTSRAAKSTSTDKDDFKKLNGFVKKLFIGLESGIGIKKTRNQVVDFFSIVLDDVNVEYGRKSDGFVGPVPKIEDLHWNKSSADGFQLLADKCQDYRLKSYYSRRNGTQFEMLVSRAWETCDEEDIQFYTPEVMVWWMLGLVPVYAEEPEVVITDTLSVPTVTTESPISNVTETVAIDANVTLAGITNETTPSSVLNPNSTVQNSVLNPNSTVQISVLNSNSTIQISVLNTNSTVQISVLNPNSTVQISVLNLNATNSPPNPNNATELPLAETTVSALDNVTTTEEPPPPDPTTTELVTVATTTTVKTTHKPRVRMSVSRKRLRFSAAVVNNGSLGKPLEITEFGFVGPLSISLISSLANYALYVVLKDCSKLHVQPKRFACVLNDYLDQVRADSTLAYRHHLAIEKYAEIGDSFKRPDESIIRNCPFNKAPRSSNHNGLGKTKSRKSKHLELPKKNSAWSMSMHSFGYKSLVAFLIILLLGQFKRPV